MISMLQALREEERQAAERAKASSLDIAREAAQDAVGGVLGYLDQKIPKGPPPKDTGELITKRIDKLWDMMEHMMESQMFPTQVGQKAPEGWEYEGPPSQPLPQPQTSQAQPAGPLGWTTEKGQNEGNEKEEDSND
jgi:hypothetical protein